MGSILLTSTFEMWICCVYIAWDFNEKIVTHYVYILKETLPIFKPCYFVIVIGVIAEYLIF